MPGSVEGRFGFTSSLWGVVSEGCGWLFGLFPDADEAGKYERALSTRSPGYASFGAVSGA